MYIETPSEITSVAWEGELIAPAVVKSFSMDGPVVSIGQPEVWPAAQALENEVGKKWTPPLGGTGFWLVRLACTLREPRGRDRIAEAVQTLALRPQNWQAGAGAVYAYSLFPDRLGVEDRAEFSVGLGPELKFGAGEFKLGELGAKIEYRKAFAVIQSYGAGESSPYWVFKPHAAHPLDGSQFVYAVLAARPGADGIWGEVVLQQRREETQQQCQFLIGGKSPSIGRIAYSNNGLYSYG